MKDTDKFVIYYYDKVCFLNFLFFFKFTKLNLLIVEYNFFLYLRILVAEGGVRRVALSVAPGVLI